MDISSCFQFWVCFIIFLQIEHTFNKHAFSSVKLDQAYYNMLQYILQAYFYRSSNVLLGLVETLIVGSRP